MAKKSKNIRTGKRTLKSALNKAEKKQVKKIVKSEIKSKVDILHYDHIFAGSQGGTYFILPYGVDSDLDKGNVCGDALPVNQLDNIHMQGLAPHVAGDSYRQGSQIFLKHIAVKLRVLAPYYYPATPGTAIIKQGPDTASRVRLIVVEDQQGDQSLDPASTNAGVIGQLYDGCAECVSTRRILPSFKRYTTDKRFRVLKTKILNLDAKKPFVDLEFSIPINKKINYRPDTDTCLTGYYIFMMSDYPANAGSHTQDPPKIEHFWLRYYYTDA